MSDKKWHIESKPTDVWDENGDLICRVTAKLDNEKQWNEACGNARLIAAAPELLAACEMLLKNTRGETEYAGYTYFVCVHCGAQDDEDCDETCPAVIAENIVKKAREQ